MLVASSRTWFITGCSTGFGRELARLVLERGDQAVVTARDASQVADLVAIAPDRALAQRLDVTDNDQIAAAAAAAKDRFGRIDVLVNNAGYGYQSSVEEGDDREIRAQFEANVFGLFAVTRSILPLMRAQRSGLVVNITSIAGLVGFPSSGYYAASKHAVEGWSDALAVEGAPLGIRVVCVEPGPFRTDWAGRSLRQTPSRIADYVDTAAKRMQMMRDISGKQAGDPHRAAQAIIDLADDPAPPRHVVMGRFAYETAVEQLRDRLDSIERQRDSALATDFPNHET